MSGKTFDENTLKELIEEHQKTLSQVSVKAVGSQVALMSAISLATLLAFSFFRPRQKKVYAPKVKYADVGPKHDPNSFNSVVPPPSIPNGFFSWFSPVLHVKEQQMSDQIGLDGVAFLRFLRLVRWIFVAASVLAGGVLLPINIVYNLRNVPSTNRNVLSLLTIQNLGGNIVFVHVAITYLITLAVMYLVWYHWQKILLLRQAWFRGSAYQSRIYSRTLMITQIRKDYRTDEGLIALMSLLKVDGIKMNSMIDCSSIGRQLEDFPDLVESHNAAVRDLEASLVKYLKHDKMGTKRPTMTKGGFLGIGGEKKDAIEYHAKEIKFLKEKIENKRGDIEQLIRRDRNARKQHKKNIKPHGENYGFVSMKTIADAHRIARTHRGRLKELFGAEIQLAPSPQDIVWKNVKLEPGQRKSNEWFGFAILGLVCALNTIPVLVVSLLANLSALAVYVNFLYKWKDAGQWGNWTFSIVSGVLPSVVSAAFGYLLPIIMRRLSKYQGAMTRSRLDRAVCQRYFAFMVVSNLFIFSLISVVYAAIAEIVLRIGKHQSFSDIMKGFSDIPDQIQGTYVQQSTYWLTYLPLRGFLFFFELAQIIKLALLSVRRLLFARTPRDIREWTTPPYFEYAIVSVNLLFIATVGLVYAPLAPLVCIGATCVFWISSVVYKYQLLYVYVSRAESGGRMWNVYVNRLLAAVVLMQLLMVLTTGLARQRWLDAVAAVPPVLMIAGFKLYMSRTAEYGFRYFTPSPVEEAEFVSRQEKRTHHKEMETRFLHPALQRSQLFTIMVHKSQEALAREVLSEYPWFRDSEVEIKAIREENLEFDPKAASDLAETRSIASTDMLATGSAVTPPPFYSTDGINSTASISKSGMAERSTDNLLRERSGSVEGFGSGPVYPIVQRRHRGETDSISGAPLLDYAQPPWASHSYAGSAVEVDQEQSYPPTAFARPVMPRADSAMSHQSDRSGWSGSGQEITQGYQRAYGYQQPRYQ